MRVHFPSLAGVAENCTAGRGGGGEGGTEAAPSIINSGILGGPGLFLLDTKHVCTERASERVGKVVQLCCVPASNKPRRLVSGFNVILRFVFLLDSFLLLLQPELKSKTR